MHRSMAVIFNKESEINEKNLTFYMYISIWNQVWGIMNSLSIVLSKIQI